MRTRPELRSGRTYMLDDFTVVQVVEITGGRALFRTRRRSLWPQRIALRRTPVALLAPRIRAEINGDFFPDIALPELYCFERQTGEVADLDAYLAIRAALWPFAGKT